MTHEEFAKLCSRVADLCEEEGCSLLFVLKLSLLLEEIEVEDPLCPEGCYQQ